MSGSAPFCGPNTFGASSNGVRTSHSTTSARAAQAAGRPRSPRSRPRRRRWCAEPPTATRITCARRPRGRGDQLAGAVGGGGPGVALVLGDERRARWPSRSRRSRCRRPRPARSRRDARGRAGRWTRRPASRRRARQQHVQRALAAVGDRAQVGRHQAARARARARSRPRPRRAERALEGVGGDEDAGARVRPWRRVVSRLRRRGDCTERSRSVELDGPIEVARSRARARSSSREGRGPITKLDLVEYYVESPDGGPDDLRERPTVLKRFDGRDRGELLLPEARARRSGPSGCRPRPSRSPPAAARASWCPIDAAHLVWAVNLGIIDLNPWPVRRADLDHPDELRVDLDPDARASRGTTSAQVALCVARRARGARAARLPARPRGSRGIHVNVRIEPRSGTSPSVRRAALALAREVERRGAGLATSKWWKEERRRACSSTTTRTPATARSRPPTRVRPVADARVSCRSSGTRCPTSSRPTSRSTPCPRAWPSAATRRPTSTSTPARSTPCSRCRRPTRRSGLGDAPWPPHFAKQRGEPKRVQPSARDARTQF